MRDYKEILDEVKAKNISRDAKFREEHKGLRKDGYNLKGVTKNKNGTFTSVYYHKDGAAPNIKINHKYDNLMHSMIK